MLNLIYDMKKIEYTSNKKFEDVIQKVIHNQDLEFEARFNVSGQKHVTDIVYNNCVVFMDAQYPFPQLDIHFIHNGQKVIMRCDGNQHFYTEKNLEHRFTSKLPFSINVSEEKTMNEMDGIVKYNSELDQFFPKKPIFGRYKFRRTFTNNNWEISFTQVYETKNAIDLKNIYNDLIQKNPINVPVTNYEIEIEYIANNVCTECNRRYHDTIHKNDHVFVLRTVDIREFLSSFFEYCERILECMQYEQKNVSAIKGYKKIFKTSTFMGAQPMTLKENHLKKLKNDYLVTPKIDGERALLFVYEKQGYFINRMMQFTKLFPMNLPNMLLDGEYIVVKNIQEYYIYDVIYVQNKNSKKGLLERLYLLQEYIDILNKFTEMKFHIKEYHVFADAQKVHDKIYEYETDGLIFQHIDNEYSSGTTSNILKWKEPLQNTIDFYVIKENENELIKWKLYAKHKDSHKVWAEVYVPKRVSNEFPYKCVVECYYDGFMWIPMRLRSDKINGNFISTVNDVWDTIQKPVNPFSKPKKKK